MLQWLIKISRHPSFLTDFHRQLKSWLERAMLYWMSNHQLFSDPNNMIPITIFLHSARANTYTKRVRERYEGKEIRSDPITNNFSFFFFFGQIQTHHRKLESILRYLFTTTTTTTNKTERERERKKEEKIKWTNIFFWIELVWMFFLGFSAFLCQYSMMFVHAMIFTLVLCCVCALNWRNQINVQFSKDPKVNQYNVCVSHSLSLSLLSSLGLLSIPGTHKRK